MLSAMCCTRHRGELQDRVTRHAIIPRTIFRAARGRHILEYPKRWRRATVKVAVFMVQTATRQSPERNLQFGLGGLRCRDVEEYVMEEVR